VTDDFETALRYFKALGDETRIRLLNILDSREFNVRELMEILEMGQSRISRHLKVLQDAALVEVRRDGLWAFYRAVNRGPGRRFANSIRYLFDGATGFQRDLQRCDGLLKNGRLQSTRFFDSVASGWEAMKRSVIGELDLVGEIACRIPQAENAADLGCGSGAMIQRIQGRVRRVIGVDSSREMLAETGKRLVRGTAEVDLRIGELEHLPIRDAETEVAIINLVLHHLRNPGVGLQEAQRILRPGGTLIVADFCKHEKELMRDRYGDHWLGFSSAQMEQWLESAGIRVVERICFPVRMGLQVFVYSCRKPRGRQVCGSTTGNKYTGFQERNILFKESKHNEHEGA